MRRTITKLVAVFAFALNAPEFGLTCSTMPDAVLSLSSFSRPLVQSVSVTMSSAFDDVFLFLLAFVLLPNSNREVVVELSSGQFKAEITSVGVEPEPDESRTLSIILFKFSKDSKDKGQVHPPL